MNPEEIIRKAKEKFDQDASVAGELAKLNTRSIVDVINSKYIHIGLSGWVGLCSKPATVDEISINEERLKTKLPFSTRKFDS